MIRNNYDQARLISRVQNSITAIRELLDGDCHEAFNDLMILARIVPKLPTPTLTRLLLHLKPLPDVILQTPQVGISLTPLFAILADAPINDPLLNDFLCSSGYPPTTLAA